MAKYYKLIDAEDRSHVLRLPHSEDGGAVYRKHPVRPGEKYVDFIDDPVFMRALKEDVFYVMDYTEDRKRKLDACGARYQEIRTQCCGGRRKLQYWLMEVVE